MNADPQPINAQDSPALVADPAAVPGDSLGVVADALARADETLTLASRHLDSSLVDVLAILGFDERYVSAQGSYLYDAAGRAYLDLHTGEGFASLGHNNPDVRAVLQATLAADLLDGVQIHFSPLAGMLAEALSQRLPEGLDAVFFASAGAEAVDAAMKFARAATGRPRLVSCESGFHGVTLGPLSLVGDEFFKEGFGPLLPGCELVPFGDLERLEAQLRARDVAAFIVEPIQGRMVTLPPDGYLQGAQELCRRYGTMFVVDEIQTGLGRTGRWFALEHWGLEPDMICVAKALSGGFVPIGAVLVSRAAFEKVFDGMERAVRHGSTFGGNDLAAAVALATLGVLEREGLVARAERMGALLLELTTPLIERFDVVADVRGLGLMWAIEFGPPARASSRRLWERVERRQPGLFSQLVTVPLFHEHKIFCQVAGHHMNVIKALPALTIEESEIRRFAAALEQTIAAAERYPAALARFGLRTGMRAVRVGR